jgi:tetratricopeptide (TPR) repeat protein
MKLFFSHSSKDKPLVREIRKQLPEHIRSWIDEKDLLIGDDVATSIRNTIDTRSDFVVLFLSISSVQSEWVRSEIEWALDRERDLGRSFILPIVLDAHSWDLVQPVSFRSRKYLLCTDFSEAGVARTAKELSNHLFAWLSRGLDAEPVPKSNLSIVDVPIRPQSKELLGIGSGLLLECTAVEPTFGFPYKTDFIGQDVFFPLLDLKLKNSGNTVAYLTGLDLDVHDVRVNTAPILEFYISADSNRDLLIKVNNCGWGPALDVYIDNLHLESFRELLTFQQKDYLWFGTIDSESAIEIVIPKSAIIRQGRHTISCPAGSVTYKDVHGKEYGFMFRYTPYPFEDYIINIGPDGFDVTYQDHARAREPSARYNIVLPTEPSKYRQTFRISHEVAPNETERLQLVIGSLKSADFRFSLEIRYDGGRILRSAEITLSIVNPNRLWYYRYLKPSWLSQAAAAEAGHHSHHEVLVRKLVSAGGDSFSEVFLHGEQIVEPKRKEGDSQAARKNRESSANAFNNIAWVLIDDEIDVDAGILKAKKALEATPDDPYVLDTLAMGYYKKESYREAIRYWEMAQERGLNDDELRGSLERARKALQRESQ